jgi:hypothetical protein
MGPHARRRHRVVFGGNDRAGLPERELLLGNYFVSFHGDRLGLVGGLNLDPDVHRASVIFRCGNGSGGGAVRVFAVAQVVALLEARFAFCHPSL